MSDIAIAAVLAATILLASMVSVEVGISDVTHVEIAKGAAEGEQVVTGPHRVLEDLKPGDHVRVTTGDAVKDEPDQRGFGPFD